MNNAEHNPYQSPRTIAPPDDARNAKATLQEKRRWRRGGSFGILAAAAVATCMSLWLDSEVLPAGLTMSALVVPPIVAYRLILAKSRKRSWANAAFALWTFGWMAACGYIWLRAKVERITDPAADVAVFMGSFILATHLAAYAGLRIGLGRKPNQDVS